MPSYSGPSQYVREMERRDAAGEKRIGTGAFVHTSPTSSSSPSVNDVLRNAAEPQESPEKASPGPSGPDDGDRALIDPEDYSKAELEAMLPDPPKKATKRQLADLINGAD